MPPVVGFQSYLANAQRIMQQDAHAPGDGGPRPADCALGLKGRSIVVVSSDRPSLEADRARSDFIDSFVKQFGEACRSIVESALLGKNAKPLTARVVIELNAKAMALAIGSSVSSRAPSQRPCALLAAWIPRSSARISSRPR